MGIFGLGRKKPPFRKVPAFAETPDYGTAPRFAYVQGIRPDGSGAEIMAPNAPMLPQQDIRGRGVLTYGQIQITQPPQDMHFQQVPTVGLPLQVGEIRFEPVVVADGTSGWGDPHYYVG